MNLEIIMKFKNLLWFSLFFGISLAQYPGNPNSGGPPGGPPIGGWGGSGGRPPPPPPYKPQNHNRPSSPFSGLLGSSSSSYGSQAPQYDSAGPDPIAPMPANLESSYDTQKLPSRLPIQSPNGVIEIYNRVVDDLLKKLAVEFKKRSIDPMEIVIRSTPAGPVRVPGYLQRRPFRRPGASLYRRTERARFSADARPSVESTSQQKDKDSTRGSGKISKAPLNHDSEGTVEGQETEVTSETVAEEAVVTVEDENIEKKTKVKNNEKEEEEELDVKSEEDSLSSEERNLQGFLKARSGEFFDDFIGAGDNTEEEVEDTKSISSTKTVNENNLRVLLKKHQRVDVTKEESVEEEEEEPNSFKKNVESLMKKYHSKNQKTKKKLKSKSKGSKDNQKEEEQEQEEEEKEVESLEEEEDEAEKEDEKDEKKKKGSTEKKSKEEMKMKTKSKKTKKPTKISVAEIDDNSEIDDSDSVYDDENQQYGHEPGTPLDRPLGGYYPKEGPPVVPAKPNAILTGLGKMRRSSDVTVGVDARSAIITARLLVGPIKVLINDSVEPLERNVKATIPELEAEILMMERHGVVFLQRLTLDRAYGQDIEISIPKQKFSEKTKGAKGGQEAMHPDAKARYQTKMAAHISMEVVKLLRSGNLRVNLMRTAASTMNKLKLPIQKSKSSSSPPPTSSSSKGKARDSTKSSKGRRKHSSKKD